MDPHLDTAEVDEESAAVGEPSANNVITSLLKAAKILSFCVPELGSDLSCHAPRHDPTTNPQKRPQF